jgi:hypothetical protein
VSDSLSKNATTDIKVASLSFTVFHADHGIDADQMAYVQATLGDRPDGFFIEQVDLPSHLGTVPNAMYGPASGDEPVAESDVHYSNRGSDRAWEDRMIDLPPRPCTFVQVIGTRDGGEFTLFTVYGGPLAPQNADDPSNQDPAASQVFWADHALSSQG